MDGELEAAELLEVVVDRRSAADGLSASQRSLMLPAQTAALTNVTDRHHTSVFIKMLSPLWVKVKQKCVL